jgi:methionine-gamma-lyase
MTTDDRDPSLPSWGTEVVHGAAHRNEFGSFAVPIYHTSTYEFANCDVAAGRFAGREPGYFYSRMGNPTVQSFEAKVANLEGAEVAAATSSGISGVSCIAFTFVSDGQQILVDSHVHYAIVDFFTSLEKFGIATTVEDFTNVDAFRAALTPTTRLVYFATPAPPSMSVVNIREIAGIAHSQEGVLVVVENTFSSPIVTRPLSLGADLVFSDCNGVLTGHGDVQGGAIAGPRDLISRVKDTGVKEMIGCVMSPHEAYLAIRGMLTLDVRLARASDNAMRIALFLESHAFVHQVSYPGLESNPGYAVARAQMSGFGQLVGFSLKCSVEQIRVFLGGLELIQFSDQVGSVQTMILHPASLVARPDVAKGQDRFLRKYMLVLSVGIEAADDLIVDLIKGLDRLVRQ